MFRIFVKILFLTFVLLNFSCSRQEEEQAAGLHALATRYSEAGEYVSAIEVLERLQANYSKSSYAKTTRSEIDQYRGLLKMLIENQRRASHKAFSDIARVLELYKNQYNHYPLTPKDLEKLGLQEMPKWRDPWDDTIYFKPLYSSAKVPKRAPDGYVLASFGKDGLPGGLGQDQDRFFKNGKGTLEFTP